MWHRDCLSRIILLYLSNKLIKNYIMKNFDLKSTLERIKTFVKHFMFYVVFVLSLVVGFSVGYYYNTIKSYKKNIYSPEVVMKKDITLAIDESNNMIVINKKDGTYIVYQDSIGYTIFNFYAKNIWGEHNSTPVKK